MRHVISSNHINLTDGDSDDLISLAATVVSYRGMVNRFIDGTDYKEAPFRGYDTAQKDGGEAYINQRHKTAKSLVEYHCIPMP